jgi:hypothetical protein
MTARWHACAGLILLLALVVACSRAGDDDKPSARILSPRDQHTAPLGDTLRVESRARDDDGISTIELRVDNAQVNLYNVPDGEKSFRVEQTWMPTGLGTYTIAVIAYDTKGQPSEPAIITVNVQPAPTPTPNLTPTVIPSATSTPGAQQTEGCTHSAVFVADVTIEDNAQMAPGTEFVKTWRMRNNGTCNWGPGYQLVFVQGDQMGGPASVDVPPTLVDATVDVEARLWAPQEPGAYRGTWRMRTPDGVDFGDSPYVQIVVSQEIAPTPTITPTATAPPLPDLDISLVSGNLDLLVGDPLALQVTVRNQGPGATNQPALVRVALGEGLEIESSVPTLPANGEVVASLTHVFNEPVDLNVFIGVDPEDSITEEHEDNNTAQVRLVVDPPLYVTSTITVTPGLRFDLENGSSEEGRQDFEWQVVEGTVYLGPLNGAGAAALNGWVEKLSYTLTAGLDWETEKFPLPDLADGTVFGFRTSDDRIGVAYVDQVLDDARTSARLTYLIWDWP